MKVVVYPHSMEIGGSQLNAIEIAAAVGRLGHDVVLVAEPGPMLTVADRLGLEHVPIPGRRRRPSPVVIRQLNDLTRRRRVDVVHGYEWPPVLDAWAGPGLRHGTAITGTVMSAGVATFIPRSIPLVVGTDELRRRCLAQGRPRVSLLEPPVDVTSNSPEHPGGAAFRASLGVGSSTVLLVVVCRLVRELKLEGLLAACRVTSDLARGGQDVELAIVGDGPVRDEVQAAAGQANAATGRRVVHMVGERMDPRPAYAGADIMLGMGGSALRGLAFGKPLVVQGERGYWKRCDEASVSEFLDRGWYGLGDGTNGQQLLAAELRPLLTDAARRARLGALGRQLVVERFSVGHAARLQVTVYEEAMESARRPALREVARVAAGLLPYKVRRRRDRRQGIATADDFNAVTATPSS